MNFLYLHIRPYTPNSPQSKWPFKFSSQRDAHVFGVLASKPQRCVALLTRECLARTGARMHADFLRLVYCPPLSSITSTVAAHEAAAVAMRCVPNPECYVTCSRSDAPSPHARRNRSAVPDRPLSPAGRCAAQGAARRLHLQGDAGWWLHLGCGFSVPAPKRRDQLKKN